MYRILLPPSCFRLLMHAVKFAEFYDKYCTNSRVALHGLWDSTLLEYLTRNLETDIDEKPENLDLLANAVAIAFQCNLPHAKEASLEYRYKYGKSRMDFEMLTTTLHVHRGSHSETTTPSPRTKSI
jgi:hypothetical protein